MKAKKGAAKKGKKVVNVEPIEGFVLPIKHWSHSSLMAFLRNPLAWYKRYVEKIYDTPSNPSSIIGRAGHLALQHFYQSRIASDANVLAQAHPSDADCKSEAFSGGMPKDGAIALGLEYLRAVPDFEINFGKAKSKLAKRKKRLDMEADYLQAIGFYLERPPKHHVLGVEVNAVAEIEGLPLPIKAISDLVVRSRTDSDALDIVDHKFVAAFSKQKADKPLFIMQAIFNYHTITKLYGKPVKRFLIYECKTSKNKDGASQMRKYAIDFSKCADEFRLFHRLVNDATAELASRKRFLPNPSDMFEGDSSFDIYRLELIEDR